MGRVDGQLATLLFHHVHQSSQLQISLSCQTCAGSQSSWQFLRHVGERVEGGGHSWGWSGASKGLCGGYHLHHQVWMCHCPLTLLLRLRHEINLLYSSCRIQETFNVQPPWVGDFSWGTSILDLGPVHDILYTLFMYTQRLASDARQTEILMSHMLIWCSFGNEWLRSELVLDKGTWIRTFGGRDAIAKLNLEPKRMNLALSGLRNEVDSQLF